MSRAELMSLVDRSTAEERLFLAAYLRHLASQEDPGMQSEVAAAHQEIDAGKKVGLLQLKKLHQSLAKSGV